MKNSRLIPFIILIGILVLSIIVCALTTQGNFNPGMPVHTSLPENIGQYYGFDIVNCQNEECLKRYSNTEITNTVTCPECGGKLDKTSLAEYQLLPKDTKILHRSYKSPSGKTFGVSVVIGGKERRSIHKPQVCLVAQGNTITTQKLLKIPVDQDKQLEVMLMEANRSKLYFAYWFTDGTYETAHHLTRLFRTAWDGIIHNERRRWAYISITVVNNNAHDTLPELKVFISNLYSEINKSVVINGGT